MTRMACMDMTRMQASLEPDCDGWTPLYYLAEAGKTVSEDAIEMSEIAQLLVQVGGAATCQSSPGCNIATSAG